MDHEDLIAELPLIEQLPVVKRLELARKRRALQLLNWTERDYHEVNGDSIHPQNPSTSNLHDLPAVQTRLAGGGAPKRRIKFVPAISLLEATFRSDYDEAKSLLEAGVDPNSRNEDGLTPLHQCCIDDNQDMLLLLLRAGADPNARDTELWAPLHAAACCGHTGVAKILVEHGADLLTVNADGNMPYDICDDDVCLEYLESEMAARGVTQAQIDYLRSSIERQMLGDLRESLSSGGALDRGDSNGATALHIAAANGYTSVVQFLLDAGASVDVKDCDSWQPMHAAAAWAQPHIVDMLVRHGADINARTELGESALDLSEEADVREAILDLMVQAEHNNRAPTPKTPSPVGEGNFFVRGSVRMSKKKKPSSMFESPLNASAHNAVDHNPSSSSRAIRRWSLRERSGATIARLEARQEALLRNKSVDDMYADAVALDGITTKQLKDDFKRLAKQTQPAMANANTATVRLAGPGNKSDNYRNNQAVNNEGYNNTRVPNQYDHGAVEAEWNGKSRRGQPPPPLQCDSAVLVPSGGSGQLSEYNNNKPSNGSSVSKEPETGAVNAIANRRRIAGGARPPPTVDQFAPSHYQQPSPVVQPRPSQQHNNVPDQTNWRQVHGNGIPTAYGQHKAVRNDRDDRRAGKTNCCGMM